MNNEQGKYLKSVACLDSQGCGSSDAMAIYIHEDNSIKNGYCYSCHKWFSADEIEKGEKLPIKKAKKVYTGESVEDILQYPILALEDRGISKEAAEFFGVRTSFNETTGAAECRYFPHYQNGHLCFKKKSIIDKTHQSFIGNISGEPLNFFGQNLTKGTQFIIVVEGEEDCLAAWDILRKAKRSYNVISLPNGASDTPFKQNFQWIYDFTQITLAFDDDKPGQDAAKKVYDLLDPGQVKLVEFKDFKDTNDYLKASADRAWMQAIYNANVKKPDGIVTISDIWEEAIRRPEWGEDWPWPKLTKLTYGRRLGEIYGIGAGTGCGKAIATHEKVPMVDGSLKFAYEVREGDLLANNVRVNRVSEIWKNRKCFKVYFDDGTSYIVDENHEWLVSSQKRRALPKERLETKHMAKDFLYPNSNRKRYAVDIKQIEYKPSVLLIEPYLLGYWLGDGNKSCGIITVDEKDQHNILNRYHTESVAYSTKVLKMPWLTQLLKKEGLLYNKHIPAHYLYSNRIQRLELLRGLLDSDGSVENGTAFFYNTNLILAKQVLELARSLGFKAKCYTKYSIKIQQQRNEKLFNLARKQRLLKRQQNSCTRKFITDIIYQGRFDTICYTVEGGLFMLEGFTETHNSEWFKELVNQVIIKDNKTIGCAFLEEPASMSAKRIAGKQSNQKFFIPDAIYDQQDLEESLKKLDNKLWLYDHNGYKDWNAIKAYFKYLNKTKGIEDFILDNLTAIVAQEDSEYTALNSIMEEMASLAESLKCRIYYASHLRKPTGIPHEENGRVQLPEFKGSGAMSNWSHFIFGLERHTQHEDKTIRNTTTFRILKDRYTGLSTGETFELWYDHNTGIYREKTEDDFYSDGKVEF